MAIAGKKGTLSYGGGNVATIMTWSLDVPTDMLDVTSFTTSAPQWRSFIDGLSQWSGSFDGPFDPSSTGQDDLITNTLTPSTAAIVLELDQTGGGKFNGSCFISNGSFNASIDDLTGVSFSFQGTGALSYTTTT